MNKEDYLKKNVENDLWSIFREVYTIHGLSPQSENQAELLKKMSDYVYNNFAKRFTRNELEKILKEINDDRT